MVEGLSHEAMSLALPEVSNRVSSDDDINWNSFTQVVPRQPHILYYQWVHSCQNEITGDLNLANPLNKIVFQSSRNFLNHSMYFWSIELKYKENDE